MATPDRDFTTYGRVVVANTTSHVDIGPSSITLGPVVLSNASLTVGGNAVLTTANLTIGNSTANVVANSSALSLANSSIRTGIAIPTAAQQSGAFFLHANGTWASVVTTFGASQRVYQSYVASAGQTVFAVSGGFQSGQIDVYYNGVHLLNSEYTQDGTNVTLNVAAPAGTLVEVVGYLGVSVALTAHGGNTEIQFSNNGIIWSTPSFTYNAATGVLGLGTSSATANGYTRLPNGILMQWGWVLASSTIGDITFPTAFPTNLFSRQATANTPTPTFQAAVIAGNTSTMNVRTGNTTSTNVYWTALGN